ncbi:MAG: sulfatase [Planctomycetes bacterium]|nr:sulfatase [Planctomycetota bacterium]
MKPAADSERGRGRRGAPTILQAYLAAILGVVMILLLGLIGRAGAESGPGLLDLAQLAGFAATMAFVLAPLLWLGGRGLARPGRAGLVLAVLPWTPLLALVAHESFAGRRATQLAAGGLAPVALGLVLAFLVGLGLAQIGGLRRRGRYPAAALLALAVAVGLHLADRRLLVGFYPLHHAACGLAAMAAAGIAFLGLPAPRPTRTRLIAVPIVLGAAATIHLLSLHEAPMARRQLILSERGLPATRSIARYLPYRRSSPQEAATEFSARWSEEQAARARGRERLAGLRPELDYNVVILSVDALRWDHTSLAGHRRDTTPFLVELARRSVLFENAYSPSTASFFSITAMLSGVYPSSISLRRGRAPEFLSERLGRVGWSTIGYYTDAVFTARSPDWGAPDQRLGFADFRISTEESEAMIPLLLDQIDRARRPFMLFSHLMDPHYSYDKHAGFDFGDEPKDLYDSEIAFVDGQLRRFVGELEARDLLERTILVITADHGEAFGEHGSLLHGGPPYEEQARVPFLIRVPYLEGGRRIRGAVSLTCLVPTLCDLLGVEDPRDVEATSLVPMIFEEHDPDRVFALIERPTLYNRATWPEVTALVRGRWKMIHDHDAAVAELYDLVTDPGEREDLAGREGERLEELRALERSARDDRRLAGLRGRSLPLEFLAVRDRLANGKAEAVAEIRPFLTAAAEPLRRAAALAYHDAVLEGLAEVGPLAAAARETADPVLAGLADLVDCVREDREWRAGAALLGSDQTDLRRRAASALWHQRRRPWTRAVAVEALSTEEDLDLRAFLLGVVLASGPDEAQVREAVMMVDRIENRAQECLVRSLMALDDAMLAPHLDHLFHAADVRVTMNAIEALGERDTELRRDLVRRFLRLRTVSLKRIAVSGLGAFPDSDWKRDLLAQVIRREPHDEVRLQAGILAAPIPDPALGAAMLDALAAWPVTGLGFGHLLATIRPEDLGRWPLREVEHDGDLAAGVAFDIAPDLDGPWGRSMRRLLVTMFRSPEIPEAGDQFRLWDADRRLVFEQRHLDQAAMYSVQLPIGGREGFRPPFHLEFASTGRATGEVYGQYYSTLIPFTDWIALWPAELADAGTVGVLSRFDGGWDCDLEVADRVFLVAAAGDYRQASPGPGKRALSIVLVGGRRPAEVEIWLNGTSLGRFPFAAGEERELRFEPLPPSYDVRHNEVLRFAAPALVGSFDPVSDPRGGLALKKVTWE